MNGRLWTGACVAAAVLLTLALVNLTVAAILMGGHDRWSSPEPQASRPYRVHLSGHLWRYYGPAAGRMIAWAFPALAGAAGLLAVLAGIDRWRRRQPRDPDRRAVD